MIGAAKIESESKAAHERPPIVGDAVVIRVAQRGDERGMRYVERGAVEDHAARAVERREYGVRVCLSVAVRVDEPGDVAHVRIGLQRSIPIDAHKNHAIVCRRDTGRIVHHRRRGKRRHREVSGRLDLAKHRVGHLATDGE